MCTLGQLPQNTNVLFDSFVALGDRLHSWNSSLGGQAADNIADRGWAGCHQVCGIVRNQAEEYGTLPVTEMQI